MSGLRDELQVIYNQHGKLTPELVVEAARPKNHPLHHRVFDRAPKEAAEAWYRHRAHELIQKCKITYREATGDEPELRIRAFAAVRAEAPDNYVYEPIEKIAENPFTRQLVLQEMEREWKQMFAKYEQFEEFFSLVTKDLKSKRKAA